MKLSEVIAIEKGIKSRTYAAVTELHKQSQKPEPFNGYNKSYRPLAEEGEQLPPERKKVVLTATSVLAEVAKNQTELFDIVASKDWGNLHAKADLEVEGRLLAKDVPATHLLFLEKQLVDMRTFVDKLPTLDETEDWIKDPNSDLYKTAVVSTHRTKKTPKVVVKYPATEQHPAQTEMIYEDVICGFWDKVLHSGAIPQPQKRAILERIDRLLKAVKQARDRANAVDVERKEVGAAVFSYLFG